MGNENFVEILEENTESAKVPLAKIPGSGSGLDNNSSTGDTSSIL